MAGTLLEALLNVQKKAPKVQKEGINPFTESRYMQLDDVVDKVLELLNEEDLLWRAWPSIDGEGRPVLRYRCTHVPTKEFEEDLMHLMLGKSSPQDQGSAITYARRYSVVAFFNLVTDKDDDGHGATVAARSQATLPAADTPRPEPQATLTPDEQKEMRQIVVDLTAELSKDFPEAWAQTAEWAKQRQIDLASPPADKLRAVERALRRKLDAEKAKKAKEDQAAEKKAAGRRKSAGQASEQPES